MKFILTIPATTGIEVTGGDATVRIITLNSGIKGDKGEPGEIGTAGNITGIANFTNANGFSGIVANNSLSLTLQYANATQDGQVNSTKFTEWTNKGNSNLTLGSTSIHAFAGDLGAGAVSNITALQGDTGNLTASINATNSTVTNLTANVTTLENITSLAVSNITALQNLTTNLTESKLNITDALAIGTTNLTAARGDQGLTAYNHSQLTNGNPHNVTSADVGLGNVNNTADLAKPISNATQTALSSITSNVTTLQGNVSSLLNVTTANSGNITTLQNDVSSLTTANVTASTDKRYVNDSMLAAVTNLSGINSGDHATNSQYSSLVSNANHTGDVTGSTVLTLATVNNNVGSFGNATTVPSFTVNEKGLITAASNNTLPISNATTDGLLNFADWTLFNNAAGNITLAQSNITTIQANLSGINTGDQNLSEFVQTSRTINNVNLTSNITLTASNITMSKLSGALYSTVQDVQDQFHSAGWVTGGIVSDAGGGLITVSAGEGFIRATNSDIDTINFCHWDASTPSDVVMTDGLIYFIYVEYNAGSPRVIATTTERTDKNTNIYLAKTYRNGTDVHINDKVKYAVSDHAGKMIAQMQDSMPYACATGNEVGAVGTRNFSISAGTMWHGLITWSSAAFDSSAAGTFVYIRSNGAGGYTETAAQTQINNTQYDDGTGTLATLSNNLYGVHWIYRETDDHVIVMYGQGNYTLANAQDAQPPAALPNRLIAGGYLVGKIIIQKNAATFTQVQSACTHEFSGSLVAEHDNLANLGWTASGHTGSSTVLAGFNATSIASEYAISGNGTTILSNNSSALGTPASGNLTNCTGVNLGYTAENTANKSTTLDTDKASDTKYASVKSIYDWAVGLFGRLATAGSWTALQTYNTLMFAIKGSSTGITKIASANASATDYTATLKAETGTIAYLTDVTGADKIVNITQVVVTNISSQSITSATVENITDMTVTKTPASASSRFLIEVNWFGECGATPANLMFGLTRDDAAIGAAAQVGSRNFGITAPSISHDTDTASTPETAIFSYLDSPATTNAVIYNVTVRHAVSTTTLYNNRTVSDTNSGSYERGTSTITVTELSS